MQYWDKAAVNSLSLYSSGPLEEQPRGSSLHPFPTHFPFSINILVDENGFSREVYEPIFLGAWKGGGSEDDFVVPRCCIQLQESEGRTVKSGLEDDFPNEAIASYLNKLSFQGLDDVIMDTIV